MLKESLLDDSVTFAKQCVQHQFTVHYTTAHPTMHCIPIVMYYKKEGMICSRCNRTVHFQNCLSIKRGKPC